MAFIPKVLAVTFDQLNVLFIIHESLIFINESWWFTFHKQTEEETQWVNSDWGKDTRVHMIWCLIELERERLLETAPRL